MAQEVHPNSIAGRPEEQDDSWRSLYKLAGVAALVATVLFLSDVIVLIGLGDFPATARDWFALLENDRLAGIFPALLLRPDWSDPALSSVSRIVHCPAGS